MLLQFVSRFHRFTFSCDASLGYESKKDFDRVHSKKLILDLISLTSHHFSTSFYHLLNNSVPRLQESKPMMLHCSQRPAKGLSRMPGSSAWMIDGKMISQLGIAPASVQINLDHVMITDAFPGKQHMNPLPSGSW